MSRKPHEVERLIVTVNGESCVGSGLCEEICPGAFRLGGGGRAIVRLPGGVLPVDSDLRDGVLDAWQECTTGAIRLNGEPFQEDSPGDEPSPLGRSLLKRLSELGAQRAGESSN